MLSSGRAEGEEPAPVTEHAGFPHCAACMRVTCGMLAGDVLFRDLDAGFQLALQKKHTLPTLKLSWV